MAGLRVRDSGTSHEALTLNPKLALNPSLGF